MQAWITGGCWAPRRGEDTFVPQQPELRGEIPAAFAELLALLPALSSLLPHLFSLRGACNAAAWACALSKGKTALCAADR